MLSKLSMRTCNTTVTTPTGVFTYFGDEVTYCQAKFNCSKIGQILAPITNIRDVDALHSVIDNTNPDCEFHYAIYDYHIGLDIGICDGKQYRMFTNNVIWNETEHGKLYKWRHGSDKKDASYAKFLSHHKTMFVISDPRRNQRSRYICLKPNLTSSVAEALTDKEVANHQNINAFYVCGAVMVALVGGMLLMKVRKETCKVLKLEKEIESLKYNMKICTEKF